jgi:hypothetical protein
MATTALGEQIKLSFSGHETFAFRYGWLKKVYDDLSAENEPSARASIFRAEEAIANFGVGKNMVASMKYWGVATTILEEHQNGLDVSEFARFIFDDKAGRDPYLDNLASLWLLHWRIASNKSSCSSWYYAFNFFGRSTFDKSQLVQAISDWAEGHQAKRIAETTFVRDVDCLMNTYVIKRGKRGEVLEDSIECPLTELGIISATAERGVYAFDLGPKQSLEPGVFYFALAEYLNNLEAKTASLEQIIYDPGSPGRVFKLNDEAVAQYLSGIEKASKGAVTWRDSAGLRQVQLESDQIKPYNFLRPIFDAAIPVLDAAE